DLRVVIVIVLCARLPAIASVIRRRRGPPDKLIDLDKVPGKATGPRLKQAQIADQPFYLGLRLVDLRISRELVEVIAITARAGGDRNQREDVGRTQLVEAMFRIRTFHRSPYRSKPLRSGESSKQGSRCGGIWSGSYSGGKADVF